MVFNSAVVVAVADVSTDTWQLIWGVPSSQRINTRELVDMGLYQLSRLVLCLSSFMYIPPFDSITSYSYEPISIF
ncbi:unnamed protein product [Eruca vesicaria subsp. sativa]|uniref:Uncharacterized protein n=1 Tax=Eruca vesicaria subsp. sativa TaxID=29727 RepID=A0ABC8K6N4_ERUVS|nr:unnamed protein product [Eruca vesicaria subsp. sativa]